MRVTVGNLARTGIESQLGTDLTETVETAIRIYTGKLTYGRPPLPYPIFLGTDRSRDFGTHTPPSSNHDDEIELTLDSQTEALLRRESMKLDMSVDAIATHAVLVYLAELDFLSAPSRPA